MIEYFYKTSTPLNYGVKNYTSLRITQDYYNRVLDRLSNYAYNREYIIKGNHLLSRFIKFCFPGFFMDDMIFFKIVDNNVEYKHKQLGMCSLYNKGEWVYNDSYENSSELYYLTNELVTIYNIRSVWKNLSPIEVIYTDNKIFDFPFIDTKIKKENVFIYKINGVLLLMQYKIWGEHRLNSGMEPNIGTFINSFVLPRMLKSYLDHTCINHFYSLLNNPKENLLFKNTTPIDIKDFTKDISKTFSLSIDDYRNKKIMLDKILTNIPLLFSNNMYDILNLNTVDVRRQSEWIKWFLRINHANMIVDLLGPEGLLANTLIFSGDINEYKEFKNKNLSLPNNTKKEIKTWFEEQIDLYY